MGGVSLMKKSDLGRLMVMVNRYMVKNGFFMRDYKDIGNTIVDYEDDILADLINTLFKLGIIE